MKRAWLAGNREWGSLFQPSRPSSLAIRLEHPCGGDLPIPCRINAALPSTESIKPCGHHGPGITAVMSRARALPRSKMRNHPCDFAFPNFGRGSGVSS